MPDFKVTLTRTLMLKGVPKALQLEHIVEDVPRPLAVLKSIGEIFEQESQSGNHLIPKEAVDFWHEARTSGSLQEYELLSELENRWGITSGIQDLSEVPPAAPPQHRNGVQPQEQPADLDTMLKNQLRILQARNAVLSVELEKKQAEFERNNHDIMRISQMLTMTKITTEWTPLPKAEPASQVEVFVPVPKKRRGRPPKEKQDGRDAQP